MRQIIYKGKKRKTTNDANGDGRLGREHFLQKYI